MKPESSTQNTCRHTVGIVGLGHIGGSFARALYDAGTTVLGADNNSDVISHALELCIDDVLTKDKICLCDMIILATYPDSVTNWLCENVDLLSPHTLVIDISGIKRSIMKTAERLSENHNFCFVGCHPMAGTQYQGFASSRKNMFKGAPMVVVFRQSDIPHKDMLLARLENYLKPCGFGSFAVSTAEEHDRIIAYTSQLAHVVSNAYIKSSTALVHKGFSAGSYLDLTRVALLNAPMWTELFLDNSDNLLDELTILIDNLKKYKTALEQHDNLLLKDLLDEGDQAKKNAERKARRIGRTQRNKT